MVSGRNYTPCTQLGEHSCPKETTRRIQRRVCVHRFLPVRSQLAQLNPCLRAESSVFFWDSLLHHLTQRTVWWTSTNRRLSPCKQVSRNSGQPPSRLVVSIFTSPLSHSSKQVSTHLKRIEVMEKDLKALSELTVAKDDFTKLRAEVKKLYDGVHMGSLPQLL